MAVSSFRASVVPWVLMALLGASCAPLPTAAPTTVAPMPQAYSCPQFAQMAAEYRALPAGSMLAVAMDDYRAERLVLFRLNGLPSAPACKP